MTSVGPRRRARLWAGVYAGLFGSGDEEPTDDTPARERE
jgi:hypothetical protein